MSYKYYITSIIKNKLKTELEFCVDSVRIESFLDKGHLIERFKEDLIENGIGYEKREFSYIFFKKPKKVKLWEGKKLTLHIRENRL